MKRDSTVSIFYLFSQRESSLFNKGNMPYDIKGTAIKVRTIVFNGAATSAKKFPSKAYSNVISG